MFSFLLSAYFLRKLILQSKRGSDGKVVASGWKSWQEFTMRSRFKGKYLEIEPLGIAHLEFPNGNHYTWRKVKTVVHNIVIGKLWIDQHGEMEIINHFTGDKVGKASSFFYLLSTKNPSLVL